MRRIGWNAVRLLVSWSRVEPVPGRYDERYLDLVARTARRLGREGLAVVVDAHQDAWGASLAAPPGTTCPPGLTPALGWDGAPAWATMDSGASRCDPGVREAVPAVLAAWRAFFADQGGVRRRFVAMWGHVARRMRGVGAVVGYDLLNEPGALDAGAQQALSGVYAGRAGRDPAGPRPAEARPLRAVGHLVGHGPRRAPGLPARRGRRLRAAPLHRRLHERADHRVGLPGRARRGARLRRRAGALGRVGVRPRARRDARRLLRRAPVAAGPLPDLGDAVDLARELRRPAQGGRPARGPDPGGVGALRRRLPHERRARRPRRARRVADTRLRPCRARAPGDHRVGPRLARAARRGAGAVGAAATSSRSGPERAGPRRGSTDGACGRFACAGTSCSPARAAAPGRSSSARGGSAPRGRRPARGELVVGGGWAGEGLVAGRAEAVERERERAAPELAGAVLVAEADGGDLLEDEREVVDVGVGADRAGLLGGLEELDVQPPARSAAA